MFSNCTLRFFNREEVQSARFWSKNANPISKQAKHMKSKEVRIALYTPLSMPSSPIRELIGIRLSTMCLGLKPLPLIVHILAALGQILSMVAYLVGLQNYKHANISGGCPVKDDSSTIDGLMTASVCAYNHFWFIGYACTLFSLMSILGVITELGILFFREKLHQSKNNLFRGIVYTLKSLCTLGISYDIGIAMGAIEMVTGVFLIVVALFGSKFGYEL